MEKYKILKQLGDGTYGSVLLGQLKDTPQEKVAIKRQENEILMIFFYTVRFQDEEKIL